MCVCVHKYAVASVNINGQRSMLGIFFSYLLPYVLRIVFHWNLRLADLLRRLASLWVCLFPLPQDQDYRCILSHLAFYVGDGGPNWGPFKRVASILLTKPPSQPLFSVF